MAEPIGVHDLASGPPPEGLAAAPLGGQEDRAHSFWELQMHALLYCLAAKDLITLDEFRRCIEGMEPKRYAAASYFEKWAVGMATVLLEKKVFTNVEMEVELGPLAEACPEPFARGDVVRVRPASFASRWRKPHLRAPGYIHGVCGVIERRLGEFSNPEKCAYGGASDGKQPLYLVRFEWHCIQDFSMESSGAASEDTVTVEVYHHWLVPATADELASQRTTAAQKRAQAPTISSEGGGPDCKRAKHTHKHDHSHEERLAVEQRAADEELPQPPIARALAALVQKKGVVTADDLRAGMEKSSTADNNRGDVGKRVVARAWVDASFRERLLEDGNAAIAELGITLGVKLLVVEQKPREHHLVVCTLCSCYPVGLLGMSPDWYKSREYRSRAVREPRTVLREFGTELGKDVRVEVHDSTAEFRYLVLPMRPLGSEGWSEEQLQTIVTRDSMVGVTRLPDVVRSTEVP